MIKLLFVIPTLDRSGAEKQLALLAAGLPRDEFDVHVAALTRGGAYEEVLRRDGIPVTVLGKRLRFDPGTLWKLRRLVGRHAPQIVHSWLFAANAYCRLLLGGRAGLRLVVSERCVDTWKSGWQLWLDRRLAGRTTRLVANSNSVAAFYRAQGYPAEVTTVIPNGVAPADVDRSKRDRILEPFGIPAGAKVVGYAGRLARQKRVKDLVWAMQLLRQLTSDVYFLVIGDGPEREMLMQFARQMTCDHVTRFAGHREDAARLIGLLDVFWLASDFEGMSNSLMEAMAAGVPVVCSDIPPNRELVVDGETGFLVPVGDSAGFAQFADRLLADRELAGRVGGAARRLMQEEFSIERMIGAHVRLYQELVAPCSRTPLATA